MKRFRPLFTLLLLALWLPATLHCAIETAGLITCIAEKAPDLATDPSCKNDPCHVLDDDFARPSDETLTVSAPVTVLCDFCQLSVKPLEPDPDTGLVLSPKRSELPPDLQPTWLFIRRLAPAPRAPALVS